MTPHTYVTAGAVEALRRYLDEADWQILHDVQQMRLARALDLQALAALRGAVHVRQFRRQLQRLYERDLLARLDRRMGGKRSGSSGWVYALGLAGQRVLDPGEGVSVRRPWTPRANWLQHAVAVSRLYVILRSAEAAGQLSQFAYESEPTCWRPFEDDERTTTLKPDAFVRFEATDEEAAIFIEVDCGTESPTTLARKLDVYRRYWQAGVEQEATGLFPEVLWLVPSATRRATFQKVVANQPEEARALHRIELYEHSERALLEPP